MDSISERRMGLVAWTIPILAAGLTGCFGGSSSDSGSDGSTGSAGDSLPHLSGLDSDADNHDLLFFTSPIDNAEGLYAIDPDTPSDPAIEVDTEFEQAQMVNHHRNFFPIHEASWDNESQTLSEFRVDRVLYGDKQFGSFGMRSVSTDPGATVNPTSREVTSEELMPLDLNVMFLFSLEEADETAVVYSTDDEYKRFLMGDDDDTSPLEVDSHLVPVALVWDPETGAGRGWLVVDTADNNRLKKTDMDFNTGPGTVHDPSGNDIEDLYAGKDDDPWHSVSALGSVLADGSQFLTLRFEDPDSDDTPPAELWHYQPPTNDGAGTMTQAENGSGEPLEFGETILPPGGVNLPPPSRITTDGDALYFAHAEPSLIAGGAGTLYRVDADGWSELDTEEDIGDFVLASAGRVAWSANEEVISVDTQGGDRQILDTTDSLYGQDISGPVRGSRDGWIFYNRDEGMTGETHVAVAAKVDGSSRIDLYDAQWVGASTSGRAQAGNQVDELELSEVLMQQETDSGVRLAAVSAEDPEAGKVILGDLPSGAHTATMFGLAPGPHRLLQTAYGESPVSYEVIYVNTQEEGSLTTVSGQPSEEQDVLRPVEGF